MIDNLECMQIQQSHYGSVMSYTVQSLLSACCNGSLNAGKLLKMSQGALMSKGHLKTSRIALGRSATTISINIKNETVTDSKIKYRALNKYIWISLPLADEK